MRFARFMAYGGFGSFQNDMCLLQEYVSWTTNLSIGLPPFLNDCPSCFRVMEWQSSVCLWLLVRFSSFGACTSSWKWWIKSFLGLRWLQHSCESILHGVISFYASCAFAKVFVDLSCRFMIKDLVGVSPTWSHYKTNKQRSIDVEVY